MAWTETSGGILALHKLAHNIASLGEKAYINTCEKNPKYLGVQVSDREAIELAKDGIAIYPEVVYGNPFKAKHVMRWLLNTPGAIAYRFGEGEDSPSDIVYKFAPAYKAKDESKVKGELRATELFLDVFNESPFCATMGRTITSHIVKKGKDKGWHLPDSVNIEGMTNQQLSVILNTSKVFISYDTACFHSVQAALCGCLSIVVPDGKMTAKEWHDKFPYFRFGIAYGLDDIEYAYHTMPLVKEHLLKLEAETLEQTKEFIKTAYAL